MQKQKKPKRYVGARRRESRIVVAPANPNNRYKLRTTVGVPGAVGHLQLTIQGQ